MTLKTGDDMEFGQKGGYQLINRIKNAFRQAGVLIGVSTAVPGMTLSDADDNKRYHVVEFGGGTEAFEILQAELVVCMNNQVVCHSDEVVTAAKV